MLTQENLDISAHLFESRGLLHCEIELGNGTPSLHCMNVHLGLFERGRQWQIRALVDRIRAEVPDGAPLIIAGDFNDWRSKGDRALTEALNCVEVFEHVNGRPARTFPSLMPVFRLDRIYARGLKVVDARVHYATLGKRMSDHAALAATFEVIPAGVDADRERRQLRNEPLHRGEFRGTVAQRRRILSRADRCDRARRARDLARVVHLRRRRDRSARLPMR
jgi:hypothetical protein